MYAKQQAIQEAITSLKKALGKGFTVTTDILETPPDEKLGDIAFPCFEFAKGESKNPVEVARELAAKIGPSKMIEKVDAVGPYVNFTFDNQALTEQVIKEVDQDQEKYGYSKLGKGKKVIVDYAQPNTHKEFHVGHIRNGVLGQSVVNILEANGYKVIPASYIGDSGADVAKAIWGLQKFHEGEEFKKEERAQKLQEIYTEATKYVEDHPEAKEEIAEVQTKLEAKEDPWHSLWKETREWSLDSFKEIFKELNIKPKVWYFESEVEEEGKKIVQKLLTDGIAKKSEGATIVDLTEEDLDIFLVLKSDGSALYATMDLALAMKKEREYDPDRQLFVVDVRQSFYFKQLFATLKKMGVTTTLAHLAYDMVTLPDGAMSSREGNVVTYRELKEQMVGLLKDETAKRHEDWTEKQVDETAFKIAIASIIFMMLRQDPKTVITFDLKEAMSVDGFTGPYVLYTIARIESIKRKAKVKEKVNTKLLTHSDEFALIRALAEYPLVVERAGQTFQVSLLAQWAFDTSKLFAEYYHEVRVLEDKKDVSAARLALIGAVQTSLTNAMQLLGIDILKEM
ncbi:MAG: arginine--tRNA ligase [Patescibacteria group bacterium]